MSNHDHQLEVVDEKADAPIAVDDRSCVRCSDPAMVKAGYEFDGGNAAFWYCRSCYEFMDDVYTVDEVIGEYD